MDFVTDQAELMFLKLGGSLLTDKRQEAAARPRVLARLAREIAGSPAARQGRLIVGHGSGSFGHVAARRHGLDTAAGISMVQSAAATLHRLVIEALIAAGAAPYSLPPSAFMTARDGRPSKLALAPLRAALGMGLLPVVYGDVVMDSRTGVSICSTESILVALIQRLRRRGARIRRVLWLGETDGVYDRQGKTIERIDRKSVGRVWRHIRPADGTDVTGGMLLRVRTASNLARLGIESWILNGTEPGLLAAGLSGREVPGTFFVADIVQT